MNGHGDDLFLRPTVYFPLENTPSQDVNFCSLVIKKMYILFYLIYKTIVVALLVEQLPL